MIMSLEPLQSSYCEYLPCSYPAPQVSLEAGKEQGRRSLGAEW